MAKQQLAEQRKAKPRHLKLVKSGSIKRRRASRARALRSHISRPHITAPRITARRVLRKVKNARLNKQIGKLLNHTGRQLANHRLITYGSVLALLLAAGTLRHFRNKRRAFFLNRWLAEL